MQARPSICIGSDGPEADKRVSFHRFSQSATGKNLPVVKVSSQKKQKYVVQSSSSHLSTWPAYEPGQGILQNRKPCTLPDWQSANKPLMPISKPRYLEELENYLRTELQMLDLTKGKVQELRLQMPLCLPFLAHLQEKICTLESVNGVLVTASDQCTQQILAFQQQEKIEIAKLKEERLCLLKLIDQMKEEKCSLETQVAKLRKTVAEEYLRYLNECDARKLLLLDLNEMYRQKEELRLSKEQEDVLEEDTVKLKVALRVARQDLTKAQVDLNTMQANYGDVVPRRDFELQERKYNDLADKLSILQKDFDDLHVILGGSERWTSLSVGRTSDQLVDVLLEEIGGGLLRERDTFIGRVRLVLRTAFPLKTDEEIQELLDAAGFRPNVGAVMYKLLFLEDEEGKTEPLIAKLKNQYVVEKQTYLNELRAELGTLVEVRPDDLRAAFCIIDHGLTEQTLDSYLSYAYQVPKEQLDPAVSLPIDILMQRLMTGDLHRQGAASGQPQQVPPSHAAEEADHPSN
ncbi:hypothetical protein Chor_013364 [Crotalus horridus]